MTQSHVSNSSAGTASSTVRRFKKYRAGRGPGQADLTQGKAGWFVKGVVSLTCLLWIVPTLGILVTSFRTTDASNSSGWWHVLFSPQNATRLTLENYGQAVTGKGMGAAFLNSIAISLPATLIPILIAAFAAYAFTFMQFPGRDLLFALVVIMLVVPLQIAFVPWLRWYDQLGLKGSFAAVWLFHAAFAMPFAIYIFRNYMATLPREVLESATIDGATHFQTFWKLILPMSVPVLGAFAIFQFLAVWNDLLVALIFIGSGDRQPLPLAINSLLGENSQGWQVVAAGGILMMLVPMFVFLSLQRYFVRGLTSGAVKG